MEWKNIRKSKISKHKMIVNNSETWREHPKSQNQVVRSLDETFSWVLPGHLWSWNSWKTWAARHEGICMTRQAAMKCRHFHTTKTGWKVCEMYAKLDAKCMPCMQWSAPMLSTVWGEQLKNPLSIPTMLKRLLPTRAVVLSQTPTWKHTSNDQWGATRSDEEKPQWKRNSELTTLMWDSFHTGRCSPSIHTVVALLRVHRSARGHLSADRSASTAADSPGHQALVARGHPQSFPHPNIEEGRTLQLHALHAVHALHV